MQECWIYILVVDLVTLTEEDTIRIEDLVLMKGLAGIVTTVGALVRVEPC